MFSWTTITLTFFSLGMYAHTVYFFLQWWKKLPCYRWELPRSPRQASLPQCDSCCFCAPSSCHSTASISSTGSSCMIRMMDQHSSCGCLRSTSEAPLGGRGHCKMLSLHNCLHSGLQCEAQSGYCMASLIWGREDREQSGAASQSSEMPTEPFL